MYLGVWYWFRLDLGHLWHLGMGLGCWVRLDM